MSHSCHIRIAALVLLVALSACASPSAPTPLSPIPAGTNTPEIKPAETGMLEPPTPATPTPTIIFAPHSNHIWDGFPQIVIVAKRDDPRIPEVLQAVKFWNEQLQSMGTPFRLGAVTESYDINPDDLVPPKFRVQDPSGDPGPTAAELPQILASIHADIIVTLTSFDITSRNIMEQKGGQPVQNGRDLIIIKNFPANVGVQNATGAIMHELGHAVGLMHDNSPLSVMCGPPWMDTCSRREIVLDQDKAFILTRYPPTWKPTP